MGQHDHRMTVIPPHLFAGAVSPPQSLSPGTLGMAGTPRDPESAFKIRQGPASKPFGCEATLVTRAAVTIMGAQAQHRNTKDINEYLYEHQAVP